MTAHYYDDYSDLPLDLFYWIAHMESSRKRKGAPASTPANDGSASKKLKLLVCNSSFRLLVAASLSNLNKMAELRECCVQWAEDARWRFYVGARGGRRSELSRVAGRAHLPIAHYTQAPPSSAASGSLQRRASAILAVSCQAELTVRDSS